MTIDLVMRNKSEPYDMFDEILFENLKSWNPEVSNDEVPKF